ncbi:MAG: NUDIX domain-containing protein [Magnetococcales bacterium]|nr:NUDIX domain-containing protein [Magnetococcales bacterium]
MLIRPSGLFIDGHRILTLRYAYHGHDRFNLPGGGQEGKETVIDTLHREFLEELGVNIGVGDLLFTCETLVQERHLLHLVFQITRISGIPHCIPTATSAHDVAWLPIQELSRDTLYPAIGPEIRSSLLPEKRHPVHLGRLVQSWF